MPKIPILSGVYSDMSGDFRAAYPRNYIPVPLPQGISQGYLRPAHGLRKFNINAGPGIDRGAINWNGVLYRVMGDTLVRVNETGEIVVLGHVGSGGYVTMDYSFTLLAIASAGNLFYYNGSTLQQVISPNLGYVRDVVWIDGYFMTTDGENIVQTELNDPFTVLPTKYGSAETDPDEVKAVFELRDELNAVGRYTIEFFENVGGSNFAFSRIKSARVTKGSIGTHSCCVFMDTIAFLGGGYKESPSIYMGANALTDDIATREVRKILKSYSEAELAASLLEAVVDESHQHLYVHLPDRTLVYDAAASAVAKERVWFTLDSGINGGRYRAENIVWCYDKWIGGDPTSTDIAELADDVSTHYDAKTGWEFSTVAVYNEGNGAIFHELELAGLTGRQQFGLDPTIWLSFSDDGINFSQEIPVKIGLRGDTLARPIWTQLGAMGNYRILKFRGNSDAQMSVAALQARLEGLAN